MMNETTGTSIAGVNPLEQKKVLLGMICLKLTAGPVSSN
jgi:hypothetical protein